jgi:hypothetical protein
MLPGKVRNARELLCPKAAFNQHRLGTGGEILQPSLA